MLRDGIKQSTMNKQNPKTSIILTKGTINRLAITEIKLNTLKLPAIIPNVAKDAENETEKLFRINSVSLFIYLPLIKEASIFGAKQTIAYTLMKDN